MTPSQRIEALHLLRLLKAPNHAALSAPQRAAMVDALVSGGLRDRRRYFAGQHFHFRQTIAALIKRGCLRSGGIGAVLTPEGNYRAQQLISTIEDMCP